MANSILDMLAAANGKVLICRLCMKCNEDSVNIFASDKAMGTSICEVIRDLLNIEVLDGDGLPDLVCCVCLRKLLELSDFKEMCLMSARELRQIILEGGLKIDKKVDVDPSGSLNEGGYRRESLYRERPVSDVLSDPLAVEYSIDVMKERRDSGSLLLEEESHQWENADDAEGSELNVVCVPLEMGNMHLPIKMEDADMDEESLTKEEEDDITVEEENVPFKDEYSGSMDENASDKVDSSTMKSNAAEENEFSKRAEYVCSSCGFKFCDAVESKVHSCGHNVEKRNLIDNAPEERNSHEGSSPKWTKVDGVPKTFKCEMCAKEFNVKRHLVQHLTSHTGLEPFHCEICGKKFVRKRNLVQHLAVHSGHKPHACETCGKAFAWKDHLIKHSVVHSGLRQHSCETCGKTFAQISSLKYHLRVHTGLRPFKCETCGKNFPRKCDLAEHLPVHSTLKPYKCNTCDKAYALKGSLRKHKAVHNGLRPFNCEICGENFVLKRVLVQHLAIHMGIKPFTCEICGKSFSRRWLLRDHKYTHTGAKPFQCEDCGKDFARKAHLVMHMVVHTRLRAFKCETCGKDFLRRGDLVRHLLVHTEPKSLE